MEKDPSKVSLWVALAPFICLLPLNIASAFLQDISTNLKFDFPSLEGKDVETIGFAAIFLSLMIGHLCFQSRRNISLKNAIFVEILLTSSLIVCQIMTVAFQLFRRGESVFIEGLVRFCFLTYSSFWPLLKLRYNVYLCECSQKSNHGFVYSSAICMQIFPSILGKMIGALFHSDNHREIIKIYFSSILAFQVLMAFVAFLTSLTLYNKTSSLISNDSLTTTSLNNEEPKHFGDGKFDSKILMYFIITAFFGVMTHTKSSAWLAIQYSTEPLIYTMTWFFNVGIKDAVFFACFLHIPKLFAVFCTGKLLDKFNKTKVLYLIMALLAFTMILRNYFGYFTDGVVFLGFYFSLLWGFCDLIQLAVQAIIAADDNGNPELFFVSGVLFCFGDLVRRIVDSKEHYEWLISFFMIIQAITVIFFVSYLKKGPTKRSEIKIKL